MAILSKTIPVKIGAHPEYYGAKGYAIPIRPASESTRKRFKKFWVIDQQREVDIPIEDLSPVCQLPVYVECDVCHQHLWAIYDNYNRSVANGGYYACPECRNQKRAHNNLIKYGVEQTMMLDSVSKKVSDIWKSKSSDEIKRITEARRKTLMKRYNVDRVMDIPVVKEKIKATNMERYGYPVALQSPEIKEKIQKTLYENSNIKTSTQQKEIFNIYSKYYNCKLNYPVGIYNGDIVFFDDNIDFEYDGSGHKLGVYTGSISLKEFERREIIRNLAFKKAGYKMIRLISNRDKLPSEEKLFEILDISKKYFNETSHSWIDFNIDTGIMRNAEHMDGVPFDFGELHKVQYETMEE